MTGGIGFIRHGKSSFDNNRKLLNPRGAGFERQSRNDFISIKKTEYNFGKASPETLKAIRERTILENRRSQIRISLLLLSLLTVFVLILILLL